MASSRDAERGVCVVKQASGSELTVFVGEDLHDCRQGQHDSSIQPRVCSESRNNQGETPHFSYNPFSQCTENGTPFDTKLTGGEGHGETTRRFSNHRFSFRSVPLLPDRWHSQPVSFREPMTADQFVSVTNVEHVGRHSRDPRLSVPVT